MGLCNSTELRDEIEKDELEHSQLRSGKETSVIDWNSIPEYQDMLRDHEEKYQNTLDIVRIDSEARLKAEEQKTGYGRPRSLRGLVHEDPLLSQSGLPKELKAVEKKSRSYETQSVHKIGGELSGDKYRSDELFGNHKTTIKQDSLPTAFTDIIEVIDIETGLEESSSVSLSEYIDTIFDINTSGNSDSPHRRANLAEELQQQTQLLDPSASTSAAKETPNKKVHLIACAFCQKCYSKTCYLIRHFKKVHRGDPRLRSRNKFACGLCWTCFQETDHLFHHIKTIHYADRRFCCEFCGTRYRQEHELKRHRIKDHNAFLDEGFVCENCLSKFRSSTGLQIHKCRHSEEKQIIVD